jgi:hypothetical protein
MRVLALVLLLMFAGCLEAAPDNDLPPASGNPEPVGPITVFAATECLQYHSFFAARAEDFASFLPPGFVIAADEAGNFNLNIEVTSCADSDQFWVQLPVEPPAELAVDDHMHVLPIEAYTNNASLLQVLQDTGVEFARDCQCHSVEMYAMPAIVDHIQAQSTEANYEIYAVLNPSSGAFADENVARYLANGQEVVGVLLASNTNAVNRGTGTAQFQYAGTGGAPPVHEGIIHAVAKLSMDMRLFEPRVQQSL